MGNAASGRPARDARRTRRPHLRALNAVVAFAKPGAGDRTALRTIVAMDKLSRHVRARIGVAGTDWRSRRLFAGLSNPVEPWWAKIEALVCAAAHAPPTRYTPPYRGEVHNPDRKQNAFVRD